MVFLRNYNELKAILDSGKDMYLLLFKSGSEQSDCALKRLENLDKEFLPGNIYLSDVNIVKDIHSKFDINSVPSFLEFKRGKLTNVIKGCQSASYLENYFSSIGAVPGSSKKEQQHQVIVYSTPACSWCNTLKSYLRTNQINFRDIDVSKDERAAAEMVRRSGQQGVPQSIMNGRLIIGFDKNKIDQVLGINSN